MHTEAASEKNFRTIDTSNDTQKTRRSFRGELLLQHWAGIQAVAELSSGEAEAYAAVGGVGNVVRKSNVISELYRHEKWSFVLCRTRLQH